MNKCGSFWCLPWSYTLSDAGRGVMLGALSGAGAMPNTDHKQPSEPVGTSACRVEIVTRAGRLVVLRRRK
jgi:hypothetical protein